MSKRWSKWIKSGAAWARIRASEARLAVYVTFYFPRNIIKKIMYQTFLPQSGILNKSIIHIDFITVCMNVAKKPIFIYRWNIIFFYIFTHIFLIHIPHMAQDTCSTVIISSISLERVVKITIFVGCRKHNMWCHQWPQNCHYENSRILRLSEINTFTEIGN